MKKPIKILGVLILTLSVSVFVLSIGARISGIYINTTPSLPVGFYKMVDEPIVSGAYVAFCPPQDVVFDMAMDRSYINRGDCPGGYGLLLKRVFAQSGDTVSIDQAGIFVNGKHLPNSTQLIADAEGQPLPQYRLKAVLNDSEYLLLSDLNPQSFDARYFGLITRDQIKQVFRPIFTWSH
ncbi:conjugative transfer signal peptidase TraF [Nitrosomonas sp. Is35]|jgi:conjugative transfer signal peptidase TraF|uniref:conjugative transfer signal peptidase TraF n=1 Tax=unclassified Nitrosomonas TaxID=2609265 RepID=UPI00294B909D|nr:MULTISPECIES: conjugative transfer signal peptidase TraF [unclassified Nitrosomonas]MDV6342501.1 conjugative transfer signal peptidase TraF [Nitrosomonas sp. Is24]MDV6348406.1 conjugative transfer signal peptidase TraF [Nitrosomonas sp. Is35]